MRQSTEWRDKLGQLRSHVPSAYDLTITIPKYFGFKDQGVFDFDRALSIFDWSIVNKKVMIDFRQCTTANYQALALLVPYVWKLKSNGCQVYFELNETAAQQDGSRIWRMMGAGSLFEVAAQDNHLFPSHMYKPLLPVKNGTDLKRAISIAEEFLKPFNVEYINTLRYVLSELLYNTTEHGISFFEGWQAGRQVPSIIQFWWYEKRKEIQFVIADVGVGIKRHLQQTYPAFDTHEDAIRYSIRPQVSGTFAISDAYAAKNNAGIGLFISSNIIRRLKADMHIISGDGLLHISPRDITGKTLNSRWEGTVVVVSVKIESLAPFNLHSLMQEFRDQAAREMGKATEREQDDQYYVSVHNYFGPNAELKDEAIRFRDKRLIPVVEAGKALKFDFDSVRSAPHSFLSALLATPIKLLGPKAYKRIKIINALPEIRETVDFILDENTDI
ncbi:DUF4325 domain-containing protein [Stenotrophomonas maltophilia]|nr:DUF4325 domain-containing protein [Stenotrophomonas maltophilia]